MKAVLCGPPGVLHTRPPPEVSEQHSDILVFPLLEIRFSTWQRTVFEHREAQSRVEERGSRGWGVRGTGSPDKGCYVLGPLRAKAWCRAQWRHPTEAC